MDKGGDTLFSLVHSLPTIPCSSLPLLRAPSLNLAKDFGERCRLPCEPGRQTPFAHSQSKNRFRLKQLTKRSTNVQYTVFSEKYLIFSFCITLIFAA